MVAAMCQFGRLSRARKPTTAPQIRTGSYPAGFVLCKLPRSEREEEEEEGEDEDEDGNEARARDKTEPAMSQLQLDVALCGSLERHCCYC